MRKPSALVIASPFGAHSGLRPLHGFNFGFLLLFLQRGGLALLWPFGRLGGWMENQRNLSCCIKQCVGMPASCSQFMSTGVQGAVQTAVTGLWRTGHVLSQSGASYPGIASQLACVCSGKQWLQAARGRQPSLGLRCRLGLLHGSDECSLGAPDWRLWLVGVPGVGCVSGCLCVDDDAAPGSSKVRFCSSSVVPIGGATSSTGPPALTAAVTALPPPPRT